MDDDDDGGTAAGLAGLIALRGDSDRGKYLVFASVVRDELRTQSWIVVH